MLLAGALAGARSRGGYEGQQSEHRAVPVPPEFRRNRAAVSVADRSSLGGGEARRSHQQQDPAFSPGTPHAVPGLPLPDVHLCPRAPLPSHTQG